MTSARPGLSPADHVEIIDLHAHSHLASDAGDAETYAAWFNGEPGALRTLARTGVYRDVLVRQGGAWWFVSRRLAID